MKHLTTRNLNIPFLTLTFIICRSFAKEIATPHQIARAEDNAHLSHALSNILIPRVVGSAGHKKVFHFIKSELESLGFKTEIDRFNSHTPIFGNLTFSNIIGKYNPNADEYLALACHYDSKYFPKNPDFVGAIDSAVPCAMMLNIAKTLLPYLESSVKERHDIGLMLIFFDGEEAFLDWNERDSVYGARHLANKFSKNVVQTRNKGAMKDIDRIEVLVLLDLIGAANSKFRSFFQNTNGLHRSLYGIERDLSKANLLEGNNFQFLNGLSSSFVDDDHRPFLQKNVPILHLITTPFPKQWHEPTDTAEHLHWPSIRNFNRVVRVFTHEYLTKHSDKFNFRV